MKVSRATCILVVGSLLPRQASSFAVPISQRNVDTRAITRLDMSSTSSPQNTNFNIVNPPIDRAKNEMGPIEATIRKVTMMTYVASLCVVLPLSLFPIWIARKFELIERIEREALAHDVAQLCARWLLYIMPFYELKVQTDVQSPAKPTIWVCNHTSNLDTFVLLASDLKLRGPNKRPIKVIYWKGLEANPVINLMFGLCGFIPVDMEANGPGIPNQYNKGSFKTLLRKTKKAFEEGFDILVLPEGQLNPTPELGLLDVFPGAHKLSLISKRPIQLVAIHGCQNLWHANEDIGMNVKGKEVLARAYGTEHHFRSDEEFVRTFQEVVGHFAVTGEDLAREELNKWLDGTAWNEIEAL